MMIPVGKFKIKRSRVGWARPHMSNRFETKATWWSNWAVEIPGFTFNRCTLEQAKAVAAELKQRQRFNRVPLFDVRN